MKVFWIVLLIVLIASIANWIGPNVPVIQALPFLGGRTPGIYDLAAFIMLLIAAWGLWRMRRE